MLNLKAQVKLFMHPCMRLNKGKRKRKRKKFEKIKKIIQLLK